MVFDGAPPPRAPCARPDPARWDNDRIVGSCLGHATVLLDFLGVRVLTDPVFSARVGPGIGPFVIGPRRRLKPALLPRDFAAPDVVVLSHAHFDHFDVRSLRRFSRDIPIVTALATADLLRRHGFRAIHELAWGQTVTLRVRAADLAVTALPVAHWGARMMRDTHRGYNGYLLERAGRRICFGGDTAYTRTFAYLRDVRRPIDLALMPIGAYNPWIRAHCTPEQAAAMAEQSGARYFVPIHHEVFQLSNEPMHEPARRIRAVFESQPERLLAVHTGETFVVPPR